MIDINHLQSFHHVYEHGGYKLASDKIGQSPSSLQKHVKSLEESLNIKLFTRTKSGVIPTENAHILYSKTQEIFHAINLVPDTFKDEAAPESITIASTFGICSDWILKHTSSFRKHNDIRFSLISTNEFNNIESSKADLIIGKKVPNNGSLVQEFLHEFEFKTYASKDYLEKYGHPKDVADLKNHHVIQYFSNYQTAFQHINFKNHEESDFTYVVNNSIAEIELIDMGEGIGMISNESNRFRPGFHIDVFPNEAPVKTSVYSCYRKSSPKKDLIEKFLAHIKIDR